MKGRVLEKVLKVIISFHQEMMAPVTTNGDVFDSFIIINGTVKGCVLASPLFALYFSVMLKTVFDGVKRKSEV